MEFSLTEYVLPKVSHVFVVCPSICYQYILQRSIHMIYNTMILLAPCADPEIPPGVLGLGP